MKRFLLWAGYLVFVASAVVAVAMLWWYGQKYMAGIAGLGLLGVGLLIFPARPDTNGSPNPHTQPWKSNRVTTIRNTDADPAHETPQADSLRQEMVDKIIAQRAQLNAALSGEVEAALRKVPRHLFVPGASLEEAYANDSVVTKRDEHGVAISSVSAPVMIAVMLEQLGVEPGNRVLEIGSGGYNAALLKELVGPDGAVTTIDIDAEVIDRARKGLAAAGYGDVTALCADGEFGAKEHAPFDRIIVTVGAWDVPPAWVDQLGEGGRLVVPLRMRGLTRSVAFERQDRHLASRSYELCGFVPMQGAGENRERLVLLHGELVGLRVDDGYQVDADGLREALTQARVEEWSGVTIGNMQPFDDHRHHGGR